MAGQANSTLYHKIESSEGMGDSFYVRGFRKVTNYFICLCLLYLYFHPIPLPTFSRGLSFACLHLFCLLNHHSSPPFYSSFSPSMYLLHLPPALQPYYTNRPSLPPSSGPRGVPPNSGPRPVTPTHVYQAGPGSQMMMIPGQQLPFPSSPQGAAYFIPGQVGGAQTGG